jgi:lipoprotein-anchoring transpeptidase ErfK/SrfK
MLNKWIRVASLSTVLLLSSLSASAGEKVIVVDPNSHTWSAYSADGELLRSGMATAGNRWCRDIGRPCKTKAGVFRIYSLGSRGCKSSKFPVGRGGAPMPYCMFFNGGQALHGSYEVVPRNVSHGCVRLHVEDAAWIRFNFAEHPNASNNYRGTKVIVRPY